MSCWQCWRISAPVFQKDADYIVDNAVPLPSGKIRLFSISTARTEHYDRIPSHKQHLRAFFDSLIVSTATGNTSIQERVGMVGNLLVQLHHPYLLQLPRSSQSLPHHSAPYSNDHRKPAAVSPSCKGDGGTCNRPVNSRSPRSFT